MDLSTAFDTVNHKILLKTFWNHYGICDSVLDWISSYLSPRWCSVMINNHCSDLKQLDVSVPQGSCSGAYFFIMYAATLSTEISYEGSAELSGFADDHILYDVFSADSRSEEMETTLNLEDTLIDVKGWMNLVKLKMNTEKTEFIIFWPQQWARKMCYTTDQCSGRYDWQIIMYMLFRSLPGWKPYIKEHVKRKSATSIRNFYKIKKIRKFLTAQATETPVLGVVISHLDYGNSLLIGCPQTTLDVYQKVQNMCAKLVLQRNKYESAMEALITLHWLLIWARIDYKLLCIAHNCTYGKAAQYLKELLINKTVIRSLHSCKYANTDFIVPFNQCKTFGDRSFLYYAPKLWNSLPMSIKQITQLDAFKKAVKTFLFKNFLL